MYRYTYYFACKYISRTQKFVIVTTGCGIVAAQRRVVPKKFILPQLVKNLLPYLEPYSSLLCSRLPKFFQVLIHINPIHGLPNYLLKYCFNIILPSTPTSVKWALSFRFSCQNPVCIFLLHHKSYMSLIYHSSLFHHRYRIRRVVQFMKFLIKQFPPVPASPTYLVTNIFLGTLFSNSPSL